MAEINLSAEQLEKLKAAMAKAQGLGAQPPQAAAAQPASTAQKETPQEPTVPGTSAAAVREAGAEERRPLVETNLAEGTYLRVDEDEMAAWLYLAPPKEEQTYTKRELESYLEKHGVVKGFHSSNLSAMIKKRIYDREILVARGAQTKPGTDGYFEYLFSPEEHGAPKVREDGSVDYSSMNALQNVHKGDKVAIYHYAVQGENGYTVLGGVMKADPVRDLPPMRGKGIIRENEVYYADSDGKIEVKDGKIDIQNVHEIMGDVDAIIGKIEFFGDVIINGNVEGGVVIRAGRNIEIHGTTGAATLYAGGDVLLSRGIQGGGKISARGNVYAEFIENTAVEAGGVVQSNVILNAQVNAKDKVITTGKKGAIIGGYTHALKSIEVITAGNDVELKTVLHCGYEPESFDRLLAARRRESEIKEKLSKLVDTMTEALREKRMRGANTSRATEASLLEWNSLKDEYFAELDKVGKEREALETTMEEGRDAFIKVDGNIYRNVVIGINAERMTLDRNTCFMKYSADKGVIEGKVIIHG
ncbi:MAG: FapA family protein [Lachnospiraceae bacterium]|nr:FapA family protein [Lachnospiraceae bacterium]MDE7178058.1 FapA family protein [Lachnospiraceae bacterium]